MSPMIIKTKSARSLIRLRWTARGWSLLVAVFTLIRINTPDPYATEPVPVSDSFLLSLLGVAILGLLIAWRWERTGAILTIAAMFIREIAWVILRGEWWVNFLLIWLFVVPPAVLFLAASRLERKWYSV